MKKLLLLLGAVLIAGLVGCQKPNGAIDVKSTPEGASIYLDGTATGGKTDTLLTEIEPGDHTIKLTLENYDDWDTTVTIAGGDTITINATLKANAFGTLNINSTPTGAAVWLDGTNTGDTTNAVFDSLPAGSHTVKLTLENYNDFDTTITLTKDGSVTLNVDLVPKTGSIQVNSTPAGAAIWLDDENTSEVTNYLLTSVPTGDHVIKLILTGYKDWVDTVAVTENQTTQVSATLEEAPMEEVELSYDEQDPSGNWGLSLRKKGHKMAVKFTPTSYPFTLTKAIYAPIVWDANQGAWQDPGDLVFFAADAQGSPGAELGRKQITPYEQQNWNEFDVSDLDITINSGSFFFAIECIKDYGSLPGYPGTMLDFAKPVHHVSWAFTSFTSPDSNWDGWLPFDEFGLSNTDWPEDMSVGDSVDVMLRVKGLVPAGVEVLLSPATGRNARHYGSFDTSTTPRDMQAEKSIIVERRKLR